MKSIFFILGLSFIIYGLLRYEGEHKKISSLLDSLWIKLDDHFSLVQGSCFTWVDKGRILSLKILDLFFEKKNFSLLNYYCSWIFIKMTVFLHYALLCATFLIRYESLVDKPPLFYGLTFYIPFCDEINTVPLALLITDSPKWYWAIIWGCIFLLISFMLLFLRYLIHKFPLRIWNPVFIVLIFITAYLKWDSIGTLIVNPYSREELFTPYSFGIKTIINVLSIFALPSIMMLIVYFLRCFLSSKDKSGHYIVKLVIVNVIVFLVFCHIVIFSFYSMYYNCEWGTGMTELLPAIFTSVALLISLITCLNLFIFFLLFILFLADRLLYLIPKYSLFEKDRTFIVIGAMLFFLSQLKDITINGILKLIIERLP